MGTNYVDRESEKAEHWTIFLIISAVAIQIFSAYANISIDILTFGIFVAMSFAGYMAIKAFKDMLIAIEVRKQLAYESIKSDMNAIKNLEVRQSNQTKGLKTSKYATSTYMENVRNIL